MSSVPIKVDPNNDKAHVASISITKEEAQFLNLIVTYYSDEGTAGNTQIKLFKATSNPGVFEVDTKMNLQGLRLKGNT